MCIHGIYDGQHLIAVNTRRSPNNANITPTFDQCCLLQCPLCQGWILRNHFTFIHPENYISVHITVAWHPCKHDKFTRWWFNVGTASYTVALHLTGIRLTFRVYWERPILYNTILIVFETCAVIRLCHNDVRHLLSSPRYATLLSGIRLITIVTINSVILYFIVQCAFYLYIAHKFAFYHGYPVTNLPGYFFIFFQISSLRKRKIT